MNISKHLIIAGALQAGLGMLLLPGVLYVIQYILEIQEGSQALDGWMMLIVALIPLYGACQLWFGISLIMQKQWTTRIVGFIFCALGLLIFPVGTAISVYTLWVLIMVRGEDGKVTEPINGEVRE